ncbi:hypothetical protein KUL156_62150 [Alteromonas sp. KUL156]|nr:hypothetical protein KUL113_56520 [Tenacibaculum sp. KUL113]GFD97026.1 hypothetical protein KUL154_57590 [Alteromonas sp. KUL154]GFE03623.1 hypothetical protein KUL156_62150 [Alteromonas sp. KUL156]
MTVFVNLHQLEILEAIPRETNILIDLLESRILQETLKVIQNLLEILVVTLLHQEVQEVLLPEAQEEVTEAHQEALEDNLASKFQDKF